VECGSRLDVEYQIVKEAHSSSLAYTVMATSYAGINAPLIESRGKLILIGASESAIVSTNELARLQSDLNRDGFWQVIRA